MTLGLLAMLLAACSQTSWGPGVVAPDEPIQTSADRADWVFKGYHFHALDDYTIRARVLSAKNYSDEGAVLSPKDLALGWGKMSDESVIKQLEISQGDRWYVYRWETRVPPIPLDEIIRSSANTHIVPANEDVAILLSDVKPDQVVTLKGVLVAITGPRGFHWTSSTTRTDYGNGACELMWVESVRVESAP